MSLFQDRRAPTGPTRAERDHAALQSFDTALAGGMQVFPANSVGRGLYPHERSPLVDRARVAIKNERDLGHQPAVQQIIYFPNANDVGPFLAQANKGRSTPLCVHDSSPHTTLPDAVLVVFNR